MNFVSIHINELIVNPENDRHGPTLSEDTAISWLLDNKTKEMKKLALRIAKAGRVFDPPMVVKSNKGYIVKDGNRRVTCVKLMLHPEKAPPAYRDFFTNLAKNYNPLPSDTLTCQLETDPKIADEIIGLRHGGTQEGEGQLNFGTREKATHANRTSGKSDYTWAQKVETYLEKNGFPEEAATIKRSTLGKIIDTEKRRARLGITQDSKGNLNSKHTNEMLLSLVRKLVSDMQTGDLTLKNLLTSKDKNAYLDTLASKGFLGQEKKPAPKADAKDNDPKPKSPKGSQPTVQDGLIKRHINYELNWTNGQSKIHLAWEQLQYHLNFEDHKISIAIVFRTLLDLVQLDFRSKNAVKDKSHLSKNLKAVGQELVNLGLLDKQVLGDVTKLFDDKNSTISIHNLHRIIHSGDQMPSRDDLISMWDCLEPFILAALKSSQK